MRRLTISHTVETHLHADFVTGSRELAARGAIVLAPAAAGIEWAHQCMDDGEEADLGGLRLRAIATPGHTPEHLAYLRAHNCDYTQGFLLSRPVSADDALDLLRRRLEPPPGVPQQRDAEDEANDVAVPQVLPSLAPRPTKRLFAR